MPRWLANFSVYYYRQVKELHLVDVRFTCSSSPPYVNMHSVTSALNKWPWARCAPRMLYTTGSRRRLFAVLGVKRVESYPLGAGQTGSVKYRRNQSSTSVEAGRGRTGEEGRNLWTHSRREMGELEHFSPMDTQHLWSERQRRDGLLFMPVLVAQTDVWHPVSITVRSLSL